MDIQLVGYVHRGASSARNIWVDTIKPIWINLRPQVRATKVYSGEIYVHIVKRGIYSPARDSAGIARTPCYLERIGTSAPNFFLAIIRITKLCTYGRDNSPVTKPCIMGVRNMTTLKFRDVQKTAIGSVSRVKYIWRSRRVVSRGYRPWTPRIVRSQPPRAVW